MLTVHFLIEKSLYSTFYKQKSDDVITIEREFGGGWVAEETVAIAVYCTLPYFDNFEQAVVGAVNHTGDSDSTGAVMRNILGAALSYNAIPHFYKDNLELQDVIPHIADDLYWGETTDLNPQGQENKCNKP